MLRAITRGIACWPKCAPKPGLARRKRRRAMPRVFRWNKRIGKAMRKAPSTKHQAPEKSQIPNSKPEAGTFRHERNLGWCCRLIVLRRSFWCLGFGAFLELGAWNLELRLPGLPTAQRTRKSCRAFPLPSGMDYKTCNLFTRTRRSVFSAGIAFPWTTPIGLILLSGSGCPQFVHRCIFG
jgi:hypothetical protein